MRTLIDLEYKKPVIFYKLRVVFLADVPQKVQTVKMFSGILHYPRKL